MPSSGRSASAVVDDLELDLVGAVAQLHARAAGVAVLERPAERLLHDAVGRQVDADRQLARLALDAELDRQAGGLEPRTSEPTWRSDGCGASASSSSSRRRTPSRRRISVSASRPLVSTVWKASAARAGSRSASRRAPRLHDHRAQRMGDDVVQLAGDPRPLLQRGGRRAVARSCSSRSAFSRSARFSRARLRSTRPIRTGAPPARRCSGGSCRPSSSRLLDRREDGHQDHAAYAVTAQTAPPSRCRPMP